MAEKKREKKTRPKSEVVKSGSVQTSDKRSHKHRSKTDADAPDKKRSHKSKSSRVHTNDSANADELRKELEAARTEVSQLTERVAALNREKDELAVKYVTEDVE